MKKATIQNADIRGHKRTKPGKSGPKKTRPIPNAGPPAPPDSIPPDPIPSASGPSDSPTPNPAPFETAPRHPTPPEPAANNPVTPPDPAGAPETSPPEDNPRQLTFNQQRAVAALIENPTIAAAARQTGVNERTIRRWLNENPDFRDELREMRQQYLVHAATRLQSTASRAVQTLLDLLASKDHIEPGRATLVRAALDFAFRSGAYTDLADRLDALEEAAKDAPAKEPELIFDRGLLEDEESEAA
jgi:transposase-like protein